jgi:hypothetical protein
MVIAEGMLGLDKCLLQDLLGLLGGRGKEIAE